MVSIPYSTNLRPQTGCIHTPKMGVRHFLPSLFDILYMGYQLTSGRKAGDLRILGSVLSCGTSAAAAMPPSSMRPGDWICPECNNHNYADKINCNRPSRSRRVGVKFELAVKYWWVWWNIWWISRNVVLGIVSGWHSIFIFSFAGNSNFESPKPKLDDSWVSCHDPGCITHCEHCGCFTSFGDGSNMLQAHRDWVMALFCLQVMGWGPPLIMHPWRWLIPYVPTLILDTS